MTALRSLIESSEAKRSEAVDALQDQVSKLNASLDAVTSARNEAKAALDGLERDATECRRREEGLQVELKEAKRSEAEAKKKLEDALLEKRAMAQVIDEAKRAIAMSTAEKEELKVSSTFNFNADTIRRNQKRTLKKYWRRKLRPRPPSTPCASSSTQPSAPQIPPAQRRLPRRKTSRVRSKRSAPRPPELAWPPYARHHILF